MRRNNWRKGAEEEKKNLSISHDSSSATVRILRGRREAPRWVASAS
jgi:hypothetical protein